MTQEIRTSSSLRSFDVRLYLLSYLGLWLDPTHPGGLCDLSVRQAYYVQSLLLGGVDGFDDFGDFSTNTKSITRKR